MNYNYHLQPSCLCGMRLKCFSIHCRFVFTSASHENGIAVFRRRQDNTLEASQVLKLLFNFRNLSITELCQSW